MSDLVHRTEAATRAADTLLRACGGRGLLLRMPAPAVPSDPTEQLGVAVPTFQDLPLGPAMYRKARATTLGGKAAKSELLVSATAVEKLAGSLSFDSGSVLFATAFGVVSDGEVLTIESVTAEQLFGKPYLYRLVVQAPLAQMT